MDIINRIKQVSLTRIFCLTLRELIKKRSSDTATAYFIYFNKLSELKVLNKYDSNSDESRVADNLILKEGIYDFYGQQYYCAKPGHYFFIKPQKTNLQHKNQMCA